MIKIQRKLAIQCQQHLDLKAKTLPVTEQEDH